MDNSISLKTKLNEFENYFKKVSKKSSFSSDLFVDISKKYDELELFLIKNSKTPSVVVDYLCGENEVSLPEEYKILSKYADFRVSLRGKMTADITSKKRKSKFADVCEDILSASDFDSYYTGLVSLYEKEFLKVKMNDDLIKAFRLSFISTSDVKWLEKIGDVQYMSKDYSSALDSYFSYAENSNLTSGIYKKLAKVFDKLGDEVSKNACLEQAKILEDSNE